MAQERLRMCGNCKFWSATQPEASGLTLPDGSGHWYYMMGQCSANSQFYGQNHPKAEDGAWGWGKPSRDLPEWASCHLHKFGKAKVTAVA